MYEPPESKMGSSKENAGEYKYLALQRSGQMLISQSIYQIAEFNQEMLTSIFCLHPAQQLWVPKLSFN